MALHKSSFPFPHRRILVLNFAAIVLMTSLNNVTLVNAKMLRVRELSSGPQHEVFVQRRAKSVGLVYPTHETTTSTSINATQEQLIQETLEQYDASSLTKCEAIAIVETFIQAGIRPGPQLQVLMAEVGFDAKTVGDLAGMDANGYLVVIQGDNGCQRKTAGFINNRGNYLKDEEDGNRQMFVLGGAPFVAKDGNADDRQLVKHRPPGIGSFSDTSTLDDEQDTNTLNDANTDGADEYGLCTRLLSQIRTWL